MTDDALWRGLVRGALNLTDWLQYAQAAQLLTLAQACGEAPVEVMEATADPALASGDWSDRQHDRMLGALQRLERWLDA